MKIAFAIDELFDVFSRHANIFSKRKRNLFKINGKKRHIAYGQVIDTYKDSFMVFKTLDSDYLLVKVDGRVIENENGEIEVIEAGMKYTFSKNTNLKVYLHKCQEWPLDGIDNFPIFMMDSIGRLTAVERFKLNNN